MSPNRDPLPPSPPDDVGADLLAHVRGELAPARRHELEALLARSPELRAERDRLAADDLQWRAALTARAPEPRRETLETLLAAVSDEAADRRAAVAMALSPVAESAGAEAVALALGQLHGSERCRVERLLADDARLAEQAELARSLADATRTAFALEPSAAGLPRLLEEVARSGPAPVHFDTEDVPAPALRRPGRLQLLGWLAPLAAAAVLFVALQPSAPGGARIREGTAFVGQRSEKDGATLGGTWRNADDGAWELDYGDVVGAGSAPLTLRVACGAHGGTPAADGPLAPGSAEFLLQPGARLARIDAAHFELLEGRIGVTTHELVELLEVRSGELYARVAGTTFDAAAVDDRLFVIVESGRVRLGRRGASPHEVDVAAGEQGMADARRVLSAPLDGRSNGDAFLSPVAELRVESETTSRNGALNLEVRLTMGPGGPVTIAGFDDSVPRFLIRLMGPEGRAQEIKVQESMLTEPAPTDQGDAGLWRLTTETPYRLRLRLSGLDLEPGRWEARLRYLSYRTRAPDVPWLGATESEPVPFEVRAR